MAMGENETPDDSEAQSTTDTADSVFNMKIFGGGEFSTRFQGALLSYLTGSGVLNVTQTPVGDINLETANDNVNLQVGSLDVDFQVADELEFVVDDPALLQYLNDNLLTLVGGGAGREWRRMLQYFDDHPALDSFLEAGVTADPHAHFTLEFGGLTGATGMGTIRRHLQRIQEGDLPAPTSHPGVYMPVCVGPSLRIHDQQVNAIDADLERKAFANLFDHLPELRHAIQDRVASGLVFADNALLSLLQRTHHQRFPLSDLRDLHDPIRTNDNWRAFIDDYRYDDGYTDFANNGARNGALVRSLLQLIYAGIRPPELYFDQGDTHFDRNDCFGELQGVMWVPGHLWLEDHSDIAGLVPDAGRPGNIEDALYPAAQYATYTTAGGFAYDSVERALVFVHLREDSLSSRGHGIVSRTVGDELGISAADVVTVEVAGMQPRHFPAADTPDMALNIMIGVDELEVSYRALGEQTLDTIE